MQGSPLKQLSDAIDLLAMVEHITGTIPVDSQTAAVPWPGIRLTVSRTREMVSEAFERLAEDEYSGELEVTRAQRNHGNSLADRIQPAPTSAGRVREIVANGSPAQRGERQNDRQPGKGRGQQEAAES